MKSLANSSGTTAYTYNAHGQMIMRGTGVFFYDEAGQFTGSYSTAGALTHETIWLGDIPVATLRPKTGGGVDIFYIHTDHLNTPKKISRPSDNKLRWRWDSTPFGTGTPNENPESLGTFGASLRLPGQIYFPEAGLHYNYFRDYDPATGRYVQSDPIGLRGGLNTFGYAYNSPGKYIDPFGLFVPTNVLPGRNENTVICDGDGNLSIHIMPLTPLQDQCIGDCLRLHERSHLTDVRIQNPTICTGQPRGLVATSSAHERRETEMKAFRASIKCLEDKLSKQVCYSDDCDAEIRKWLNSDRAWLRRYRRYEFGDPRDY